MISVAEAERRVLEGVESLPEEACVLAEAHGRILRQALVADRDLPPFDRVMVDGFAVRHAAWQAGIRRFRIAGVQPAGTPPQQLQGDTDCIEVMTGAVLPAGADAVVAYEDVSRGDDWMELTAGSRLEPGQAVHRRASDRTAGTMIVPPGVRLGGVEIAVAAGCGCARLTVSAQPSIAVLATGDELVDVGSAVAPHQVRRSNDYALRAALVSAGYPDAERHHLRDDRGEIERRMRELLDAKDVVLVTGGVSKGKFDFLPQVLDALGVEGMVSGVAQRPGKPFWFGRGPRRNAVFALPGNPASSFVCLHRYVLPALEKMSGRVPSAPARVVLAAPAAGSPRLTCFVPAGISPGSSGEPRAMPSPLNTSGDFAGLAGTDGFLELPPGAEPVPAGATVRFWKWR